MIKTTCYSCIIIIILFVLYFNYILINNNYYLNNDDNQYEIKEFEDIMFKEKIKLTMYNIVFCVFLITLMFYTFFYQIHTSLFVTFFTWIFCNIGTPIPETGLLVSLPIKYFFDIDLTMSQIIISIFSLCVAFYYYIEKKYILKTFSIGRIFNTIMDNKFYSIIITSILASIFFTGFTDIIIDFYRNNMIDKQYFFLYLSLFLIHIVVYFQKIIAYKLWNKM